MQEKTVVNDIAEKAAEIAIKKYEDKKKREKLKQNLYDIDRLLRIYNALNSHVENAVDYSIIDDILVEIESIRRSKMRTIVLTNNIDIAFDAVRKELKAKKEEYKLDLLKDFYFNNIKIDSLIEKYNCDKATIYRWLNATKEKLATHLFGANYYFM